jgi:predicted Zn-dependent protease
MDLLERSGFNPEAMPRFFERLQTANRYNDPANVPEFLRDHPVTTNRIADARARADQYPRHPYKDSAAFYLMRARIRVLTSKDPQQALVYFRDTLREGRYAPVDAGEDSSAKMSATAGGDADAYLAYSATDKPEEAARYGYALALMQVNEYGKARLQLQRLLQAKPESPTFLLASARLDIAEKEYKQGLSTYENLLRLYPGYRPAVIGLVEALLANNQAKKAQTLLRDYISRHDTDPTGYKLLAEAEGHIGDDVESHMAQAEYYYNNGDLHLAIEQLKLAQKVKGMSYYQRERVRARLDKFQKEFDEQKKEKKEG